MLYNPIKNGRYSVDAKTYVQEAIKTESLDFDGIKKRLNSLNYQKDLFNSLQIFNQIGEVLDFHKKYVFYGKGSHEEVDLPDSPEFNFNSQITDEEVRLLHAVLGIATEAQEMIDQITNLWKNKHLDKVNLGEEVSDIFWYSAIVSDTLNQPFEKIMETNIQKLRARYGEKFSSEKAINRDLDKERIILENLEK
jgi:NTP pyrophosphatase (non-canonical NTP hydrolase)